MLIPSSRSRLSGCREKSKRLVCGSNLKGIGTAMMIYANDSKGLWPVPAFDESRIGQVHYVIPVGGGRGTMDSPNSRQPSIGGNGGSREISVTRALWLLVRSGDTTTNQFVCPTGTDETDPTTDIDLYYDFASYANVSYGYQVPFGHHETRAREGADSRMIIAADKGPYYLSKLAPNWNITASALPKITTRWPRALRKYNSPNHSSPEGNEGQNCLYIDGHVTFDHSPVVGLNSDNIYTVSLGNNRPEDWMFGQIPYMSSSSQYPRAPDIWSDSVIFP